MCVAWIKTRSSVICLEPRDCEEELGTVCEYAVLWFDNPVPNLFEQAFLDVGWKSTTGWLATDAERPTYDRDWICRESELSPDYSSPPCRSFYHKTISEREFRQSHVGQIGYTSQDSKTVGTEFWSPAESDRNAAIWFKFTKKRVIKTFKLKSKFPLRFTFFGSDDCEENRTNLGLGLFV